MDLNFKLLVQPSTFQSKTRMCLCLCANEGREETTKDSVCNAHLNFRSCFSRKKVSIIHGCNMVIY